MYHCQTGTGRLMGTLLGVDGPNMGLAWMRRFESESFSAGRKTVSQRGY